MMKPRVDRHIAVVALAALAAGCMNGRMDTVALRSSQKQQLTPDKPLPAYVTSTVMVTGSGGGGGGSAFIARIFFNAALSAGPITDSCSIATQNQTVDRSCRCVFTWDEMNTTSGSVIPVTREVTTPVTNLQSQLVECPAPSVYATEIDDQTIIRVKVIPTGGSPSQFTNKAYNLTKNSAAVVGSFQDAEGRAFDNILRYSCFDTMKRGLSITNSRTTVQNGNAPGENAVALAASQFCLSAGPGAVPENTPECNTRGAEFSAQSYYYNLYTRSTNKGSINLENTRYKCPLVREAIGTTSTNQNDFYPLDSTFALALTPSAAFPVGVEAAVKAGGTNDSDSGCFNNGSGGGGSGGGGDSKLIKGCLGFAAKPDTNGSCPTFRDANGTVRPTYRLRRFIALYPPIYDTDGKLAQSSGGGGAQSTDVIYVADRPVTYPGADPLKLYTMLGPKPCPFSYYDHRAVTRPFPGTAFCDSLTTSAEIALNPECSHTPFGAGPGARTYIYMNGMPSYAATNSVAWNGTNVDGIQFPHEDLDVPGGASSCSTALPIVSDDKAIWSIATVHRSNPIYPRVYVRPVQAWSPYYQEDTNFLACAPQSTPFKDPPLHFAKDPTSGNVAWCAETYPSQNPYVRDLEKDAAGFQNLDLAGARVANFTSHVAKNSLSATCTSTAVNLPTGYAPLNFAPSCTRAALETIAPARHHASYLIDLVPNTGACGNGSLPDTFNGVNSCFFCSNLSCDRTVQNSNLSWTKFPLLARPDRVEQALRSDKSYQCSITYDAGNGKTGTFTPREGCCGGAVKVWTGLGTSSVNVANTSAHLEPDVACQTPLY